MNIFAFLQTNSLSFVGGRSHMMKTANECKKLVQRLLYLIVLPEHLAEYNWLRVQENKYVFNKFKNIRGVLFDLVSLASTNYSIEQFEHDLVNKIFKFVYKLKKKDILPTENSKDEGNAENTKDISCTRSINSQVPDTM